MNTPVILKRSDIGLDKLCRAGGSLEHRAAPGCPEVDTDRDPVRADEYMVLEGSVCGVECHLARPYRLVVPPAVCNTRVIGDLHVIIPALTKAV